MMAIRSSPPVGNGNLLKVAHNERTHSSRSVTPKTARQCIAIAFIVAAALLLLGDYRSDFDDFVGSNQRHRILSPSEILQDPKAAANKVLEADGAQQLGTTTSDSIVPKPDWSTTNWIDIHQFVEGFSGWKVTLLQVLEIVERLPHVTLVEPCMVGGRLVSCGRPYPNELTGSPVPVSEILDVSWALELKDGGTPAMALYNDFLRRTKDHGDKKVKQYQICLKASQPYCPEPFDAKIMGQTFAKQVDDDEISIYQFYMCWWGRCALEINRKFAGGNIKVPPEEQRTGLKIHSRHFQMVKDILKRADITDHYSLIQWRGERKGMDYIKCAEHVVNAKRNMKAKLEEGADHPFLLMTSLSEDIHMQWNGELIKDKSSNGSPKEALDILREDGFLSFDKLLEDANLPLQDMGMLAVYELVLATMSRAFATCANGVEGCTDEQHHFCRECNYMGKFARLALDMRLAEPGLKESTFGCWPL